MIDSEGTIGYNDSGLFVYVDPEIVRYARSLIPKSIKLNHQKYKPHISVVRKEIIPTNMYGLHDGEIVKFQYSQFVYNDECYYWLRAYSSELTRIRVELGLPEWSEWSRPPDGTDCFHITIGNLKWAK